jgi:hypothetical protein
MRFDAFASTIEVTKCAIVYLGWYWVRCPRVRGVSLSIETELSPMMLPTDGVSVEMFLVRI